MKELLMGNEAIALGALMAGVNFVSGYPGTPSTEILETVAKRRTDDTYVEWSVNEKNALEVAAGAAYCGARAMVTMKQVGLNVASDPLMCVNYVGVKGGLVIISADDPGPISSQTEQDTRHFGKYAKIPVFDPTTPEDAFIMIQDAFEYSEKYHTPVLFRPTTRVCHSCADIDVAQLPKVHKYEGFKKDVNKWVIFPRLSYQNKLLLEKRETELGDDFSSYKFNTVEGTSKTGIACGGVSTCYVKEALSDLSADVSLFCVATPFPFPEKKAVEFLKNVDRVLVIEELDPVIEDALMMTKARYSLNVEILGKRTGNTARAGENSARSVKKYIANFCNINIGEATQSGDVPQLPVRPPVLCAGCPHRASFYAVKQASKGIKSVYCGDIGCYTLGNAKPLDMTDTCLCMGAGITIAQGIKRAESDTLNFAFVGDSTFFHSGIVGVIDAVYNKTDMILCVLDNSTTAMTGHQPHPGIGTTMMGDVSAAVSIEKILKAVGVDFVETVDPLNQKLAIDAVKRAIDIKGVRVIIFKSPCIAIVKSNKKMKIDAAQCVNCKKCIRELGCPAISVADGQTVIEPSLCTGCSLCAQVCPVGCIVKDGE